MSTRSTIAKTIGGLTLASVGLLGAMHQWESQELTAYADKLAGGLPTYCSGATSWKVKPGTEYTQEQCDAVDAATASEYGRAVLDCVPADRFDQNSFDAFTLFAINVGKVGACNSRAARLLRAGDRVAGCHAMARGPDGAPVWSFTRTGRMLPNGTPEMRLVRGLQNRRVFESNWCLRTATGATS